MKRRLVLIVLLALAGLTLGAGTANAATQPTPDNPLANAGYSAFSPPPNPLPSASDAFDPNDLLSHYGTAGATWHYYDLNPLEEVGASLWVEVTNDAMGLPKLAISAVASLATWVFNPTGFLDNLRRPTDNSAKALHDNLATPWLPVLLLVVAIGIAWGARTGRLGMAFTRVLYSFIGLALIGLAVASPSSIASQLSGLVTDTVSSVLVPTGEESVKSDADAVAADQARKNIGGKMLGPLWRTAVYDPWVMGTFGSPTSKTAEDNAGPLFQAQALTWNEAAAVDGKKDETNALVKQNKDDWAATAKKVNENDPIAYRYLQGSNPSLAPVFVSYMVTLACLPFITVAILMVLAGYLALFILAALLPIIGLAVIVHPPVLAKVGRFAAGILINTVIFAAASVIILKLANALLGTGNVLFSTVIIAMASWVAWKLLRGFRGFTPVSASAAASTAAVSESVETVKKKTKKVTKAATKQATKQHGEPVKVDGDAPASVSVGEPPAGAKPVSRPAGSEPAVYVPVGRPSTNGHQQVGYVPTEVGAAPETVRATPTVKPTEEAVETPAETAVETPAETAPAPYSQPVTVSADGNTRSSSRAPYVPAAAREAGTDVDVVPVEPADIPGAKRSTPSTARAAYIPPRAQFEDEEVPA